VSSLYGRAQRRLERLWLERRAGFPPQASQPAELGELGHDAEGRERYGASPYGLLRRALRRGEVGPDDVFLDLGCGMGRVLYEAGRLPFKRVIGVDVVPQFTSVAREVLARNEHRLRAGGFEVVTADALDYEPPDDLSVVFLGAPFGEPILPAVLEKLVEVARRGGHPIRVIAYSPSAEPPELEQYPGVRLLRRGRRQIRRWAESAHLYVYEVSA